jgi:hypothetical protein
MQIQFEISLNDLIAFAHYWVQYSPFAKAFYRITFIGTSFTFFIVGVVIIFTLPGSEQPWLWGIIFLALGVAWLFIMPIWYRSQLDKLTEKAIEKYIRTKPYQAALGKQTVSISDGGLLKTTAVNQRYWPWSRIERIEQNDAYIFIFFNSNVGLEDAHIIPKCAFANEERATEFYDTTQRFLARG